MIERLTASSSVSAVVAAGDRTLQQMAAAIDSGTAVATAAAQQVTHHFTTLMQQAKSHLDQVTAPVQPTIADWQQTVGEAMQQVNTVTNQTMDQMSQTARTVLDQGWQQTEFLTLAVADRLQMALLGSLQDWLVAHPLLNWLLSHPFYSLGLVLLLLFLTAGLLRAIAHLTEQIWLFVLRLPLRFSQWLFNLSLSLIRMKPAAQAAKSESQLDSQQRLNQIMTRLEALQQEQDQLMRELKTILTLEQNYTGGDR